MKIKELYNSKRPVISFEVFPPKKTGGIGAIDDCIQELSEMSPDYISVTYSAGGSGESANTLSIASSIRDRHKMVPLVHLTCINSNREEIQNQLQKFRKKGIENLLALRGDMQKGTTHESDYLYAKDLISDIKKSDENFCVGAAAYPEGHMDCESIDLNIKYLKEKENAGAEFFITQLFFQNEIFYRFYEKVRKAGISAPVSAGIMPVLGKNQVDKMIYMCAASLPATIIKLLNRYDDPQSLRQAGIEYAQKQVQELIKNGADGVHIYTMNKSDIAKGIVR